MRNILSPEKDGKIKGIKIMILFLILILLLSLILGNEGMITIKYVFNLVTGQMNK